MFQSRRIRFAAIKTKDQQAVPMPRKARELLVQQRRMHHKSHTVAFG
ncbi:hypothetical protein [Paracoccus ravus]|nr:hypothetical protein [Paracoccus ravus]